MHCQKASARNVISSQYELGRALKDVPTLQRRPTTAFAALKPGQAVAHKGQVGFVVANRYA